jgi:hypothetical protein
MGEFDPHLAIYAAITADGYRRHLDEQYPHRKPIRNQVESLILQDRTMHGREPILYHSQDCRRAGR